MPSAALPCSVLVRRMGFGAGGGVSSACSTGWFWRNFHNFGYSLGLWNRARGVFAQHNVVEGISQFAGPIHVRHHAITTLRHAATSSVRFALIADQLPALGERQQQVAVLDLRRYHPDVDSLLDPHRDRHSL